MLSFFLQWWMCWFWPRIHSLKSSWVEKEKEDFSLWSPIYTDWKKWWKSSVRGPKDTNTHKRRRRRQQQNISCSFLSLGYPKCKKEMCMSSVCYTERESKKSFREKILFVKNSMKKTLRNIVYETDLVNKQIKVSINQLLRS